MQSPYKKIIVYDLETGGFDRFVNPITEIAMVVVDLENLQIIDQMEVMLKPRIDFEYLKRDSLVDAKSLYKNLAVKDEELNMKVLKYGEENITLKNIESLIESIEEFYKYVDTKLIGGIAEEDAIDEMLKTDIGKLFVSNSYNPQALQVTGIKIEDLKKEGVVFGDAFEKVVSFIEKHTVGNSKPIIAGHNIGSLPRRIVKGKEKEPDGFDNPFMELFFQKNKDDFFYRINDKIIDTLKEARIKWYDLPNFSLGTCANEVGLTLKEAHRALADTVANAKFLIKMLENLRGFGAKEKKYERRKFKFNF